MPVAAPASVAGDVPAFRAASTSCRTPYEGRGLVEDRAAMELLLCDVDVGVLLSVDGSLLEGGERDMLRERDLAKPNLSSMNRPGES